MGRDPAFLFYPNDYLGGTMGMSFEMKGAYIDLLIFQFNNHQFTEAQAKQVLSICFIGVWEVLKNKFKKDGEYYFNERLRNEIDKRKAFSESRRINALHPKKPRKAYAKHMGNENRNRNKSKIINLNEGFEDFWKTYPRKVNKKEAQAVWDKSNLPSLEIIITAIEKQKKSDQWLSDNGKFIPYPASWLNKEKWNDEEIEPHPLAGKVSDKTIQNIEMLKDWEPANERQNKI
jgi:uncharacterized protein YdaU (DUF1376 family)